MPDGDDVAVADDVVFGFAAHQAVGFDFVFADEAEQVFAVHRFRADEAAGQIGVDAGGGFDRGAPFAQHPRADFFVAGGEKQHLGGGVHDVADQRVAVVDLHAHFVVVGNPVMGQHRTIQFHFNRVAAIRTVEVVISASS